MAEINIEKIAQDVARKAVQELRDAGVFVSRWVSISEMLPENKTYVLTTIHIPGRSSHARSGWYQDGFFHNDNGDVWRTTDMEVEAWMPLPEPYVPETNVGKKIESEKA